MASALCRRSSRLLGVPDAARRLARLFSAAGPPGSDEPYIAVSSQNSAGPRTIWPDETMGPFGPQDQRFQLPGNVGFECHLWGTSEQRSTAGAQHRVLPDVLTVPSSAERHEFVLAQFLNEYQNREVSAHPRQVSRAEAYFGGSGVECSVCSCPELLKQELESFFPTLPASNITVVTVTQKNSETREMEAVLPDTFINGAKEICSLLWRGGYWADFIHPLTGQAFFRASSVFSDDRLLWPEQQQQRHSGFRIEDVASCRLIGHPERGSFLGTLVTNAPANSLVMQRLRGETTEPDDLD